MIVSDDNVAVTTSAPFLFCFCFAMHISVDHLHIILTGYGNLSHPEACLPTALRCFCWCDRMLKPRLLNNQSPRLLLSESSSCLLHVINGRGFVCLFVCVCVGGGGRACMRACVCMCVSPCNTLCKLFW